MSCRAVKKWVWRHGADELPPSLIGHLDECVSCRALLSEVRVLDGSVGRDETPDPGEAYWANFAPRLARRLDETPQPVITVVPAPWRWRWVRRWAPVTGIAILAVLLGQSVINEQAPPGSFDSEVPVEPVALTDIIAESQEQAPGDLATRSEDPTTVEPEASHQGGPALTAQTQLADRAEDGTIGPGIDLPVTDETAIHEWVTGIPAGIPTTDDLAAADDGEVWPERQVYNLGQVSDDTPHQRLDDDRLLNGQGSFGVYERQMASSGLASETAGVHPLPSRLLEGPRLLPASGFADGETPTEAMRRFDQIRELRDMIGDLQAIRPELRSAEQNARLSSLWYRLGTITGEVTLIDSAIQVLGEYLKTLPAESAPEWSARRNSLIQRREAASHR